MLPQFGKVKSKTIRNIKRTQNKLHIYKQFHFTVQREACEETVEEKIFIQTAYAPYILPMIYIYIIERERESDYITKSHLIVPVYVIHFVHYL
jgi:hypothetical protein